MINKWITGLFKLEILSKEEQIERLSLIRIILLTCVAGLGYSAIYIFGFQLMSIADVVVTYVVLSLLNLTYFYYFKNYNLFRIIQMVFIAVLPILSQLFIGGFIPSSAVGLSGILAPIGALLYFNQKVARRLMFTFILLLILAGVIEYFFLNKLSEIPREIEILFFVLILGSTSLIIYSLLEYFISENKKISNELNLMYENLKKSKEEIEKQNFELLAQREKILVQKEALEEQNRLIQLNNDEIKASIKYASFIQNALLPGNLKLQKFFQESIFTIYKPRDVVSGDFYWCEKVGDKIILITSDCTGHGVPGAFMSMLGVSGLNSIVFQKEITEPNEILNQLHDLIFRSLNQEYGMSADGMDISVVVIDKKHQTIEFAGAMNPMYYISKGEVHEIKGDKQPVGGLHYGITRDYKKKSLDISNIEMIYLASDGYQDQFGGKTNTKFMKRRFKDELQKIHAMPMKEQKTHLENSFFSWMEEGAEKQIDDVLVLGLRVG